MHALDEGQCEATKHMWRRIIKVRQACQRQVSLGTVQEQVEAKEGSGRRGGRCGITMLGVASRDTHRPLIPWDGAPRAFRLHQNLEDLIF